MRPDNSGNTNTSSTTGKNGIRRPGDEVDWLTRDELHARYPPLTNMPDGAGTHVLKPNGHPWYYDTALSGGVGGKANTRIGNQTATWQGSNIIAGPKGLIPGEEIFVPYTHGSSYILTADDIDDRHEHWCYVAKGRRITIGAPTSRISSTRAPPRSGGRGGKPPCRGPCFSTRRRRVCANLTSAAARPARIGYPPIW